MLTEPNGLVLNILIYSGQDTDVHLNKLIQSMLFIN